MGAVVAWPAHVPIVGDELPEYLAEPRDPPGPEPARLRDLVADAHRGAQRLVSALNQYPAPVAEHANRVGRVTSSPSATWQRAPLSAGFFRMVELPGSRLGAALAEWWTTANNQGVVAVDRRFEVGEPDGQGPGWTMRGRIRRVPRLRWTAVIIDMWPAHERWTMLTMTPQSRVVCTRRYFRTGHRVLDRLTATLAETSAARAE
jgi:hypothetical protein